jgi:hypothetical protein
LFDKDQAKLAQVCANQLSYGHSDGRVETKDEFITAVMGRKATLKSLAYPELKVALVGDAAIACPSPSSTARPRPPGSASCRSGRSRPGLEAARAAGIQTAGPGLTSLCGYPLDPHPLGVGVRHHRQPGDADERKSSPAPPAGAGDSRIISSASSSGLWFASIPAGRQEVDPR